MIAIIRWTVASHVIECMERKIRCETGKKKNSKKKRSHITCHQKESSSSMQSIWNPLGSFFGIVDTVDSLGNWLFLSLGFSFFHWVFSFFFHCFFHLFHSPSMLTLTLTQHRKVTSLDRWDARSNCQEPSFCRGLAVTKGQTQRDSFGLLEWKMMRQNNPSGSTL